ncbi:hypothetical protein [Sabulicella rubraurantiaca]|uniref:hypothetical protein n=1 Tax=Sabulicella rubraurantiaca TaxID=2811429 RepID=UPI001A975C1B|nr:hypothetical protein [Sabulicella rubraurantiaca]
MNELKRLSKRGDHLDTELEEIHTHYAPSRTGLTGFSTAGMTCASASPRFTRSSVLKNQSGLRNSEAQRELSAKKTPAVRKWERGQGRSGEGVR